MKKLNLSGKVYGRLTVLSSQPLTEGKQALTQGKQGSFWLCRCDCGMEKEFLASNLNGGKTKSCGCLRRELTRQRTLVHGHATKGVRSKELTAWRNAKERCYRKNLPQYQDYGGRGISMSEKWLNNFSQFLTDMGPRPKGYTLERIDVNGNYSPDNCKWASRREQAGNTRTNVRVDGVCLAEYARMHDLNYDLLHHLYATKGLPLEQAVQRSKKKPKCQ